MLRLTLAALYAELPGLDSRLRAAGINCTSDMWLAVYRLLQALERSGRLPLDPSALARVIRPLLCKSPEQQTEFDGVFDDWLTGSILALQIPIVWDAPPVTSVRPPNTLWRAGRWLLLFAALVLLAPEKIDQSQPESQPPHWEPPPTDVPQQPSEFPPTIDAPTEVWWPPPRQLDVNKYRNALSAAPWGLLGIWLVWRYRRQRVLRKINLQGEILRKRLYFDVGKTAPLFSGSTSNRTLRNWVAPDLIPGSRLDVTATAERTAQQGGWFAPCYRLRQAAPQYLLLVRSRHREDHAANLVDALAESLAASGIELRLFRFRDDPRWLLPWRSAEQRGLSLQQAAERYAGARLIVVSDLDVVGHPLHGRFRPWLKRLEHWPLRIWLNSGDADLRLTARLELQGYKVLLLHEKVIETVGVCLEKLSISPPGTFTDDVRLPYAIAADLHAWLDEGPPPGAELARVMDALRTFLGESACLLLQAVALFPEPRWRLTEALEFALFPGAQTGERERRLLRLARLPWLQHGFLPDYLRKELLRRLSKPERRRLQTSYRTLLAQPFEGGKPLELPLAAPSRSYWRFGAWFPRRFDVRRFDPLFAAVLLGQSIDRLDFRVQALWMRLLPNSPRLVSWGPAGLGMALALLATWGVNRIPLDTLAQYVAADGMNELSLQAAAVPPEAEGSCRPLLMAGKRTLFQQVLTRPGAWLAVQPGDTNETSFETPLLPLSNFYVYDRRIFGGEAWLLVGKNIHCQPMGWVQAGRVLPWRHRLTVAFDNPAGRDRVLLFQDAVDLQRIVTSRYPAAELDPLLAAARTGRFDNHVIAAEPENYIDFAERFYLLPIIDFKTVENADGERLNLLQIYSITKNQHHTLPAKPKPPKAAVVFVIDSGLSMTPYIKRTKEAIEKIFDQLRDSPNSQQLHFGLVAFRSNVKAVPGLEYLTKLVVDPNQPNNEQAFIDGIDRIDEAKVSGAKFGGDAFAGVERALTAIDWSPYQARYVVLITNRGALDAADPLSATGLGADEVAKRARDQKVTLYAIHLKTPQGLSDHAQAEAQYRQLTRNAQTGSSLYYEVFNAEDIANFGAAIDCQSRSITKSVLTAASAKAANYAESCPPLAGKPEINKQLDQMRKDAGILGHALGLEYLGLTAEGQGAPPDFEGWISERDIKNPVRPNVEIRILLTRNEFNNFSAGVKAILDAAKAGQKSPTQFFLTLREFVSRMVRDPSQAEPKQELTVADMGLFGEYLDDLPYKSTVMALNQDIWQNFNTSQKDEFLRGIQNKLERYQYYEANSDLWVDLSQTGDADDKVYPIPLDALP